MAAKVFNELQQAVYEILEETTVLAGPHHWTNDRVKMALNDARLMMMSDVVDDVLYNFTAEYTATIVTATTDYALPTDFMRLLVVRVNSVTYEGVTNEIAYRLAENSLLTPTTAYGNWTILANKIRITPTPAANIASGLVVTYVRVPTTMSAISDVYGLPIDLERALVYKAAVMLLEQDKDLTRRNMFEDRYNKLIFRVGRKQLKSTAAQESETTDIQELQEIQAKL